MNWTDAEDAVVRSMYATSTRAEIAAALGRSEGSVRSRCWTLGLNTKSVEWSDDELDTLRRYYAAAGGGPVDLAGLTKAIGRDRHNICRKAKALGLTNARRAKCSQPRLRGLGKYTAEELRRQVSERTRRVIAERGHPRGMLGKVHSDSTKAAIAVASRRAWANPASKLRSDAESQRKSDLMSARNAKTPAENVYSRCARGRREDLGGIFFRSRWEANYARYLEWLKGRGEIVAWEYEPQTFWFEKIKRGTRSYLPDFKVTFPDGRHEWHEVKGWMDQKSRTKLDRMARYYPSETVVVIGAPWFKQAARGGLAAVVPGWER